jgi:protein disulfide-isomerase-like protein
MPRSFVVLAVLAATCLVAAQAAGEKVTHLTPSTFDSVVGQDKPALVEFFAPWCGHCKRLAPIYAELADKFSKENVVIADVDADQHKELSSRFGVQGFPTIKYFPARSTEGEDYNGGRELEDLVDFINRKAGTNVHLQVAKTAVTVLTDDNFDSIVLDSSKHVFVEFYAPWCGHCKRLAPTWDELGKTYDGESDVVIAKLDADRWKAKATKYGVTGYPTLMSFPKYNKEGIRYQGGREIKDLVDHVNKEAGAQRTPGGGFTEEAGRVPELDDLAKQFVAAAAAERAAIITKAEAAVAATAGTRHADTAKFYVTTMKKVLENPGFAAKEVTRLDSLVKAPGTQPAKKAEFSKRMNIVKLFAQ